MPIIKYYFYKSVECFSFSDISKVLTTKRDWHGKQGSLGKAIVCQEQITAAALKANEGERLSHRDHLRGRCGRW